MSDPTAPPPPPGEGSGGTPPGHQNPPGGHAAPDEPMSYPGQQPPGGQYGQPGGQPGEQYGRTGGPGGYQAYPTGPGYDSGYHSGHGRVPGGVGAPATLFPRFLARLVDNILLGIVGSVIGTVLLVSLIGLDRGGPTSNVGVSFGSTGQAYAYGAASGVLGAAIALAYFVLMETKNNGQTLGKMLLRLRVEGPSGGPPDVATSVRRNFWVALGALAVIPVIGGLGSLAELVIILVIAVTIARSATSQGWHDDIAGGSKVTKIG